jgi:8-oxo-dGTP diphosphatase
MTAARDLPKEEYKRLIKYVTLVSTDGIVFDNGKVLLLKRRIEPFEGYWVLPGGHLRYKERLEECVVREVKEETGLDTRIIRLVGVYSAPDREPRGHAVSVCYLLKIKGGKPNPNEESSEIRFFDPKNLPDKIGFDHRKMIEDALQFMTTIQS